MTHPDQSSPASQESTPQPRHGFIHSGLLVFLLAVPLGLALLLSPSFSSTDHQAAHPEKSSGHGEGGHQTHGQHTIVLTSPLAKDVRITEQYVSQIHARRNIEIRALSSGYLDEILIGEGQVVEKGDLLFKIRPVLYQTRYDAELAEARLAELELQNALNLLEQNIVSENEVALFRAKLAKARAKAQQAEAELQFTSIRAPFSGIVDRLEMQLGSLIEEGEHLTTLSDNSVLWVYFNVPEARYLDYMADEKRADRSQDIELKLANGKIFGHAGVIGAIEAQFDNETGNIPFRADFPNPEGLLCHDQTGNVLIHHTLHDAVVIPQRATFEVLDRRYVFVVDDANTVHQREITIATEQDDIFLIETGLEVGDRIVLEGIRQVRDGQALEKFEFLEPRRALADLKHPAE